MINNGFFYGGEIAMSRFEYVGYASSVVCVICEKRERYVAYNAQYANNPQYANAPQSPYPHIPYQPNNEPQPPYPLLPHQPDYHNNFEGFLVERRLVFLHHLLRRISLKVDY